MATLTDVERIVESFDGVVETTTYGNRAWGVGRHTFAWVRPFSKADVRRFGDQPVPAPPILAIRTLDLGDKEAILADGLPGVFTIAHFDGYPAVLVELAVVRKPVLRALLTDAWRDARDQQPRSKR